MAMVRVMFLRDITTSSEVPRILSRPGSKIIPSAQSGYVANVCPEEQVGVARRENGLHGFLGLLFGDVIHLGHVRHLDALRVDRGEGQDAERQNYDGNHCFQQSEARL